MKIKTAILASVFTALGMAGTCVSDVHGAPISFSMQFVADNDFAVFGGNAQGINELLYQNNSGWPEQISDLSTMSFTLQSGDSMFYILAMGGGGQENVSGLVNGVDITDINVSMSSDVGPYLTDYENQVGQPGGGTPASATFDASLADVQAAFSSLTWGNPDFNKSDTVIQLASPNGYGYDFASATAHLFSFSSSDVGVPAVPEPSSIAFAVLGGLAFLFYLGRK